VASSVKLTAEQTLARRVLMRRRMMPYVQHFRPRYLAGWVHQLICRRLERFSLEVEQELSPRLMFLMPPRHGKSVLVSEEFPGWHLGRCPFHEFISASYNISLPINFSRRIRTRLRDPEYNAIFPDAVLDADSQSVEQWQIVLGGAYLAAGVGGGITGKGAHILSIDDPVKNAEEAASLVIRDALWDWYGSTAYTRLAPGGGVLITQTWWNEDDLAGRIQELMSEDPEFDQFEIVKFPAIADEDEYLTREDTIWRASDGTEQPEDGQLLRRAGEALHPERYDLRQLRRYQKTMTKHHWAALYQQNPVPEDGMYFTKDMFHALVNPLPGEKIWLQAWDLAISEKTVADWSVGACGTIDYDDNVDAIDQARFRTDDSSKLIDHMLDFWVKHGSCALIGVEDGGQQWKTMKAFWARRCEERRLYPMVVPLKPVTDKAVRARPLQGRMQNGKVRWNTEGAWFAGCQKEMLRFQAGGTKDDQVDAWAWLVQLAMTQHAPHRPKPPKEPSWKDALDRLTDPMGASHMAA
jgi:phage terminase large subunit-like protein